MIKNIIISGLLMYILSERSGWAVAGYEKVFVCFCLTILLAVLISLVERIGKKYV